MNLAQYHKKAFAPFLVCVDVLLHTWNYKYTADSACTESSAVAKHRYILQQHICSICTEYAVDAAATLLVGRFALAVSSATGQRRIAPQ